MALTFVSDMATSFVIDKQAPGNVFSSSRFLLHHHKNMDCEYPAEDHGMASCLPVSAPHMDMDMDRGISALFAYTALLTRFLRQACWASPLVLSP